jgi:hypothetical protein
MKEFYWNWFAKYGQPSAYIGYKQHHENLRNEAVHPSTALSEADERYTADATQ